jgi:hypothetical protein
MESRVKKAFPPFDEIVWDWALREVLRGNCASCHGSSGEGSSDAPPVVGKSALTLDPRASAQFRKVQFRAALGVAQCLVKNTA